MTESNDNGVIIQGSIDQLIRDIESGKCAERYADRIKAIRHFMEHEIEDDTSPSFRLRTFGDWECR